MPKNCLVSSALTKAQRQLEWLGLEPDHKKVRDCAGARLRYASLRCGYDAPLLLELADDLECHCAGQSHDQCRYAEAFKGLI
jgi:hypothetical protein